MNEDKIPVYKQCYLMSRDDSNSWHKTCWISVLMAIPGKKLKITHDDKVWTVLEVYPEEQTLEQVNSIKNRLKDYNSYRKRGWDENSYNPKTGK